MVSQKKTDTKGSPERPLKEEPKKGKPRSPGRPKSPGRSKSPGRPKSPGRSKQQEASTEKSSSKRRSIEPSKSPKKTFERSGRLTPTRRSPIRKSPSRSAKISADEKDKIKDSAIPVLHKRQKISGTDTDPDAIDEKLEVKEKPKAAVRGRTRTDLIEKGQGDYKREISVESSTSSLLKRVTRSQNREVERIVHLKHFETIPKKIAEFSDEDDLDKGSADYLKAKVRRSYEFVSPIGVTFLILALPILVALLFVLCNEKSCSFIKYSHNYNKFRNISTYLNTRAYFGYAGYTIFLTLLTVLPFGGRKVPSLPDKHEKFVYIMNGLLSAFAIILIFISLELKNVQISKFIIDHHFQLYLASLLVGLTLSVIAYIRSFYVPVSALNPQIVGKNKIYNFFTGRELHPRIFGRIDLKVFVYRLLFISAILADLAFVYNNLGVNINLDAPEKINIKSLNIQPTLLTFFLLHCIYLFDGLIFEHTWITSKDFQQEGFGYRMTMSCLMYPVISSFIVKYIVEHNVQLAYWKLAMMTLVFLLGYVLYRGSNNQKDAFRKNPYNPSFSRLETIPTTQGKKLLSSGFWGFVRHPNYLGNILMELSLIPFVLCAPPVFFSYLNIVLIVYRAQRDNYQCKQKYGAAWDRYCNRVRFILVPKVY